MDPDFELIARVRQIHSDTRGSYGSRRMSGQLRQDGYDVGRYRARSLMKKAGVSVKRRKKFKRTTDSNHNQPVAPNLLNRQFEVERPDTVWCGDRGSQYADKKYQKMLERYGMVCSMSRKGDCWDNAVVESFFHSLKTEWISDIIYQTRDEARSDVIRYIEMFYNTHRLHSFLEYKPPNVFENNFSLAKVA
jgi:transposase InsO family protein